MVPQNAFPLTEAPCKDDAGAIPGESLPLSGHPQFLHFKNEGLQGGTFFSFSFVYSPKG